MRCVRQGISSAALLATIVLSACGSVPSSSSLPSSDTSVGGTVAISENITASISVARSSSTVAEQTLPPGETWTTLSLHDGDPTLPPSRVLFDLTRDAAAAISTDGLVVVSRPQVKGLGLYSLGQDGAPVDTGIHLVEGSSIRFGPHGDLFTIEPEADIYDSTRTVSELSLIHI